MQQDNISDNEKNTGKRQEKASDAIGNAHAAGDGAISKSDVLTEPDADESRDPKTEELRKEAEKY